MTLTWKDLDEKYGAKRKTREKINRAIRAELVGGDDCLDAMEKLHRLTTRLKERGLAGQAEAQDALNACRRMADFMADLIADKYQLKSSG